MKLYADKLTAHLKKHTAPVYLLHGDEPFQLMELSDSLRQYAGAQGYAERQVLLATEDADWAAFREAADSLSLFSARRLIELRLPSGKPGRAGGEILQHYCSNPPEDVLLVIVSAKLDRGGTSSAWFKAIDKVGVTIAVWPIPLEKLSAWVADRLRRHGLSATPDAIVLITERVEGNMLAAAQEVERLALLYPEGEVSVDDVLAAVADCSRHSVNDLTNAALRGDVVRTLRVLHGLRDESVAPVLLHWSLAQEIRSGARAAEAHEQGMGIDAALKSAGVWQNRAAPLKIAITRHPATTWLSMLTASSHLDRLIKGQASGNIWEAFEDICVQLAGRGERVLPEVNLLSN